MEHATIAKKNPTFVHNHVNVIIIAFSLQFHSMKKGNKTSCIAVLQQNTLKLEQEYTSE